jgi:hypothetical protein
MGFLAILQLEITAYCLRIEKVHFSGFTGLAADNLI